MSILRYFTATRDHRTLKPRVDTCKGVDRSGKRYEAVACVVWVLIWMSKLVRDEQKGHKQRRCKSYDYGDERDE